MTSDVLIVGGGPAGVIAALTVKSVYPEKSVCLLKDIGDGVIPCAIPYMIHTLPDPALNRMGDAPLEKAGVEVCVDRAVSLNTQERQVILASEEAKTYERLILATGTGSILPQIPGAETPGVFTIRKSLSDMTAFREAAHKAKKITIIGGGFIGAEFADEFSKKKDVEIQLVEMMPHLLFSAFDDEFCDEISHLLSSSGVSIHTGQRVASINGGDRVRSVSLQSGEDIESDLVLISIGARPNAELAETAGLRITDNGSIWVDDYMRTAVDGVFAVGDCAVKRDFFTRKAAPVWLASTATAEARIAGTNLYGIRVMRQIQGTIAAFSTRIGGVSFASAGMTHRTCEKEGFRSIDATAEAPDRHPGNLPGASKMKVKLVFANRSGILLGGQISGGDGVGELINAISLGIQKKVTVREIDMMQIATHPLLTSAPTVHPFINAAHQALAKMRASFR